MDKFDQWRLCEELTVVQAALLCIGEDPSHWKYIETDSDPQTPDGYDGMKAGISTGLKKYVEYQKDAERSVFRSDEDITYLNGLSKRCIRGNLMRKIKHGFGGDKDTPIAHSIDVEKSTVDVESLKSWLTNKGYTSTFFFPEMTALSAPTETMDFLDPKHPRYAPKLAAAVNAWLAVKDARARPPKKALRKWLEEHAADFNLVDKDGKPTEAAMEECSKVANWNTNGGATKTPT